MGKVHRIKKSFRRLVAQEPLPVGTHWLAKAACIYIGRTLRDGTPFVIQFSSDKAYKGLIAQLIKDYEAGVALSDEPAIKQE